MSRKISPIAAQQGQRVVAKADQRCSCSRQYKLIGGEPHFNPTCPVHGHGRPAGRGV